jgi:hypothetical protein
MLLRIRAGELEGGRQWVARDGVVYVGATALHPETRTWLHLHHDDPEIGRMRARFATLADEELDVIAVELPDGVDRQQVRHSAVALLAEQGLLSERHVCDPPIPAAPTERAAELVAAIEERLTER